MYRRLMKSNAFNDAQLQCAIEHYAASAEHYASELCAPEQSARTMRQNNAPEQCASSTWIFHGPNTKEWGETDLK